jgi:hypothetical protein
VSFRKLFHFGSRNNPRKKEFPKENENIAQKVVISFKAVNSKFNSDPEIFPVF